MSVPIFWPHQEGYNKETLAEHRGVHLGFNSRAAHARAPLSAREAQNRSPGLSVGSHLRHTGRPKPSAQE